MPKREPRRTRVGSPPPSRKPLMPFSLILPPGEMNALRKIADKEGVAIAVVIRRAIHTVIDRAHPEFKAQMVESEASAFLDQLATRFPGKLMTAAKRKTFRTQLISGLK